LVITTLLALAMAGAHAAEHRAGSAAEVARLADQLRAGDSVVLEHGTWKDQVLVLKGKGSAERPIVFRSAVPGKTVLSGKSAVVLEGDHLVLSGVSLQDGEGEGDGVRIAGKHCRLTDSSIVGGKYKFFVHMFGEENRMDHCYLADKTSDSPTLQIEVEGKPNHHRIDNNYFGPRPALGRNGGETIRVGYSGQSMTNSRTVVERNLFDRCDGEIEIVSNKSCENVYRFNTFLNCAGMLTLRHGNRCLVEGNFFLGGATKGSGGIRVIGEGHTIVNNYISEVTAGGIWITAGIPNSPLVGYFQARDCLIAFNTIRDSRGPYIHLDAGMGTSQRTLRPERIVLANNLLIPSNDEPLFKGVEGANFTWTGNLASGVPSSGDARGGVRHAEAAGEKSNQDGIWRPSATSTARGKGEGEFPEIAIDIDGSVPAPKWAELTSFAYFAKTPRV
jgi:poly(beta-D-mannuronate) lyase